MKSEHKELATIDYVKVENFRGDGGPDNTVTVGLDLVRGGCQGFGGLQLADDRLRQSFVNALLDTFAVHRLDQLKGMKCYALRAFSHWNADIVGIASIETGRRMTIRDWRRQNGLGDVSVYEMVMADQTKRLSSLKRDVQRVSDEIAKLSDDYVEWN